jgi:hypothetical protein
MVSGRPIETRRPAASESAVSLAARGSAPKIRIPGADRFGDGGAPGEQTAAADRRNQRIERPGLFQQFQGGGSLATHDHGMVERRHQRGAGLLPDGSGNGFALLLMAVVGDDFRAVAARGFELRLGSILRHHDGGLGSGEFGRNGYALRMIARGIGEHSAPQRVFPAETGSGSKLRES